MPEQNRKPSKVSIIGSGMVGSTLGYSLIMEGTVSELVLVDVNRDRAEGEAMDINHAIPFTSPATVTAGDYADCRHSDIIVITAGIAQSPGESRLALAERNIKILSQIVPRLVEVAPDAIILVLSNPVDLLTYATVRMSGLPWQHVIGSGTVLDTARFRYELSARCKVDPRNIHAYIIGEHGDSEVPAWSLTNIAGVDLEKFCQLCGEKCSSQELTGTFERVRNAAYEIIRLKGATYYGVALGTVRMIEAILRDQNTILTASTLLQGQYGLKDICLSLPAILGREGVRWVVEIPLSEGERRALIQSAEKLKEVLKQITFEE